MRESKTFPRLVQRLTSLALLSMLSVSTAHADLRTETIDYQVGGASFRGMIAYDDAARARCRRCW